MDIMRLLTRKLKSQSLEAEEEQEQEVVEQDEEEVEEVEEKETGSGGRRTFPEQRRNNDTMQATEFDSGTASNEDVTEFEEAPPCLHGIVEANLHCQVVEETQQMDRTTMDPECFSSQPNATSYSSSTVISPQHVVSSVMMTMPPASKDSGISSSSSSSSRQSGPAAAALSLASGRLSAVSSDFEWCSLDFEPPSSSCSSEMDQHSSEEELVSIYHRHEQKRKHSQMSSPNDNQCTSGEEEDAEEELNEEDVEERFPRDCDHHRPLSSSSNHRCLHGNHRCLHGNVGIPISASDFASPRKRHRQTTTTTSINSTAIQQQQRPSLDLYKMQKTSITRKYNGGGCSNIASTNCRPRVVKIRTITGSSRPAKSAYNPSVFSFRSISWASSRLKEEPFRAF